MTTMDITTAQVVGDLREAVGELREGQRQLDTRIDRLESNIDARMDRLESNVDARMDRLESNADARMDRLESKMDRMMFVGIGFMGATIATLVATIVAAL